jgi:phage terminase small subunit
MTQPKRLTEMQMKFAHELVTNEGRKTGAECAIAAGYSSDAAVVYASKLYPLVVQYIGQLRSEYQKKYDVTFERHISELAKLRDNARESKAWSAAVNAEVARGKAAGLYVEQKIIRTGKLEDLTAEQLEARMKEIINEYSPILEGVVLDDIKEEVKSKQNKINYSSSSSSKSSSKSESESQS